MQKHGRREEGDCMDFFFFFCYYDEMPEIGSLQKKKGY